MAGKRALSDIQISAIIIAIAIIVALLLTAIARPELLGLKPTAIPTPTTLATPTPGVKPIAQNASGNLSAGGLQVRLEQQVSASSDGRTETLSLKNLGADTARFLLYTFIPKHLAFSSSQVEANGLQFRLLHDDPDFLTVITLLPGETVQGTINTAGPLAAEQFNVGILHIALSKNLTQEQADKLNDLLSDYGFTISSATRASAELSQIFGAEPAAIDKFFDQTTFDQKLARAREALENAVKRGEAAKVKTSLIQEPLRLSFNEFLPVASFEIPIFTTMAGRVENLLTGGQTGEPLYLVEGASSLSGYPALSRLPEGQVVLRLRFDARRQPLKGGVLQPANATLRLTFAGLGGRDFNFLFNISSTGLPSPDIDDLVSVGSSANSLVIINNLPIPLTSLTGCGLSGESIPPGGYRFAKTNSTCTILQNGEKLRDVGIADASTIYDCVTLSNRLIEFSERFENRLLSDRLVTNRKLFLEFLNATATPNYSEAKPFFLNFNARSCQLSPPFQNIAPTLPDQNAVVKIKLSKNVQQAFADEDALKNAVAEVQVIG